MRIELAGQAYQHRSRVVDAQECVNLYAEQQAPGASTKYCLMCTPGLKRYADAGVSGGCRALYTCGAGDRAFGVIGSAFVEIMQDGRIVVRGEIGTSDGMVSIADNGLQVLVSDGKAGYIFNLKSWRDAQTGKEYNKDVFTKIKNGTVKLKITDSDEEVEIESEFPAGSHVACMNGYFVANKPATGAMFVSRYYDGEIWDAANYAIAESMPDNLLSIVRTNNELWLFGSQSIEVWFASGQSFPFARVSGAHVDIGTAAPWSPATIGGAVFWLGSNTSGNNSVWTTAGFQPRRISTHAIEYLLGQMPRTDDAIGFCYQQEGHQFYVLTFKSGNKTLCYDMTTGLWHERGTWDTTHAKYHRHPAVAHCMYGRRNLVGVHNAAIIYEWRLDQHTDDGAVIRSVRTWPHIATTPLRALHRRLIVDMEAGNALPNAQNWPRIDPDQTGVVQQGGHGSEPQLMLQWSDDGGYSWSREVWGSTGRLGEYARRVSYHNLGASYRRTYRLVLADPVPRVLLAAYLDIVD